MLENINNLKKLTIKDLAILYCAKKDRIKELYIDVNYIRQEACDRAQLIAFLEECDKIDDEFWKS